MVVPKMKFPVPETKKRNCFFVFILKNLGKIAWKNVKSGFWISVFGQTPHCAQKAAGDGIYIDRKKGNGGKVCALLVSDFKWTFQ